VWYIFITLYSHYFFQIQLLYQTCSIKLAILEVICALNTRVNAIKLLPAQVVQHSVQASIKSLGSVSELLANLACM